MPLARAIPRAIAILLGWMLASCETVVIPTPRPAPEIVAPALEADAPPRASAPVGPTARIPATIRSGVAQMVVQRVEDGVSREEVAAAIQAMIAEQSLCISWPAIWIESLDRRVVLVRFDLMARDWGEEAVTAAEARMLEFVELGFMIRRERPDIGPGVVEFALTPEGRAHLDGALVAGGRPKFCGSVDRHIVDITSMEWGEFRCGSLHVRFTHVADDWPSWARTEAARARIAAVWPPVGEVARGEVSFSRQWIRPYDLRPGQRNGALRSLCYQGDRLISGNDLNLATSVADEDAAFN